MELTAAELSIIVNALKEHGKEEGTDCSLDELIKRFETESRRMNLARLGDDIKMLSISEQNKELIKIMDGCEVWSQHYEACVGIVKGNVIRDGKRIDILNTNKKIERIWSEYCEQEVI